ncbi:MAG TPA: ABC transporter substrate-binding protein [Clostridia bacterium]|nr:ABC transporter substrate-binding protein [Clostridia bacterium]
MKKLRILIALFLLAICLLAAQALAETPTRVISLAPSITEVIVDLGAANVLVGVDTYSAEVEGIPEGLPATGGMTDPDVELLTALEPQVIFISSMSNLEVFEPLTKLGVQVVNIPSSSSVEAIYEDNLKIGQLLGLEKEAEAMNADMRARIEAVAAIGQTVQTHKKVYFELGAAPFLYSLGQGTFLDELIALAGADNVFHDQEGWLSISEEAVLAANPDVILTGVHYIDNAVDEILARPGWENITAVANKDVYLVDGDTTARPNHRVALALEEMARCIYPDLYE